MAETGDRHCWGVFGANDELGAVNRLTPDITAKALAEARAEKVFFSLQFPLDEPIRPQGVERDSYTHRVTASPFGRDDLWTVSSSSTHLTGTVHVIIRFPKHGYFGGRQDSDLDATDVLGIDRIARRGIVTRALLVDVPRYMADTGGQWNPMAPVQIGFSVLESDLGRHGLSPREGDVLLVRTGFMAAQNAGPVADRHRSFATAYAGLDSSAAMAECSGT